MSWIGSSSIFFNSCIKEDAVTPSIHLWSTARVKVIIEAIARALFFTGEIGEEISEKLYNAVAVALAYVYKLDRGEEGLDKFPSN